MDSQNHQLINKIVIKLGLLLTVAILNAFYTFANPLNFRSNIVGNNYL